MATSINCARGDGDCTICDMYVEQQDVCLQDPDFGGTGHGDDSYSDADPGL